MNKPTDEQVLASFLKTRSYKFTAQEVGLSRAVVERRIWKLRAAGTEVPKALRRFERPGLAREAVQAKIRKRDGHSREV